MHNTCLVLISKMTNKINYAHLIMVIHMEFFYLTLSLGWRQIFNIEALVVIIVEKLHPFQSQIID